MTRNVSTVARVFCLAPIVILAVSPGSAKSSPQVVVTVALEQTSIRVGTGFGFKFSITNHWKDHTVSFFTCPTPYEMEMFDSQGSPIPKSEAWQRKVKTGVYTCESTLVQEVAPGQTLGPYSTADDPKMFDLKPGNYSGRLLWHFSTTTGSKPRSGKTITVPSNTFQFTVVP